jgi:hypothetical protein
MVALSLRIIENRTDNFCGYGAAIGQGAMNYLSEPAMATFDHCKGDGMSLT